MRPTRSIVLDTGAASSVPGHASIFLLPARLRGQVGTLEGSTGGWFPSWWQAWQPGLTKSSRSGDNREVALPQRVGLWRSLGARFHGMEEVVGSIPTRSTIESITYRISSLRFGSIWQQIQKSFLKNRSKHLLLSSILSIYRSCFFGPCFARGDSVPVKSPVVVMRESSVFGS